MNAPYRTPDAHISSAVTPRRVVHVVRQFYPNRGGLEDVVANLAREQLRLGIDARVVTLDRLFSRPGVTLPETDSYDGIPIRRIPFRGSSRYPLAPSVMKHLGGADLIHVHAVDFFFDALALARPFHRTSLVATTHGGFFHTADFSVLKKAWFHGPTRLTSNLYDAIVACSPSDARTFEQIAPSKVTVIENGADLAKFDGASSPTPVKRMVTVGRFSKNKHPERLIATIKALLARDPDWKLDLIGAESDWSAEALRAEIAAAGVADAVDLHVGLDNRAVADVMRRSSLFVSASDFEGFGVALIEAMSAGLAPVVHPNAAFEVLAARHGSIRLVDFADPARAADEIRASYAALLADPAAARPSKAELVDYAWRSVAERYQSVYRAVVGRAAARAPVVSGAGAR